jgi:acyl-homoserine lactone acylase PvdQ
MQRRTRTRAALALFAVFGTVLGLAGTPASAAAARATPIDYCAGQCRDVLPPGENGNATLADILANRVLGTRPPHTDDQLGRYDQLLYRYNGLTDDQLSQFFNDASFGVAPDAVASVTRPRDDVTIVRDRAIGVPHITGTTRYGTEFGAGYAAAQDRLWLMDVLRHVGRGELSGFAGGAPANRELEQAFWRQAPYTEADLRGQVDRLARSGPRGQQLLTDVGAYVDGINAYIAESHRDRDFPGEYVLTGHANAITNAGGAEPFTVTDTIAIASVVGALFGTGGGGEVQSALAKLAFESRYGAAEGDRLWQAFREREDPEAVLTLHDGQRFRYGEAPANAPGVAMPDAGSVTPQPIVYDPTGSAATGAKAPTVPPKAATVGPKARGGGMDAARGIFDDGVLPGGLLNNPRHGMSNALVVSGAHTDTGHPVAVFGPQTGYFAPQLLMLEELQGPGISARGAAFAGTSMYVQLGRGQDYAWSATTAGQDITDTFAVPLCEPDGAPATRDSEFYLYHGQCLPMERLERDDAWQPTVADQTPAGSYKLIVERTRYGLVDSRGTVGGRPVAFTSLRSTYQHEADSAIGFQELNDPGFVHSAADFQRAATDIGYTFNWFYVDSRDTAYFNSGANPVRAPGADPNLPTRAEAAYEWRGWDPATNTADYTPPSEHPNSTNQDYYVSWNNKQALDYGSAGYGDGPIHRVNLLNDRVKALVSSGTPVTRAALTQAMEDAANADLRGTDVLPELLRVIGSAPVTDPDLAAVVRSLTEWQDSGAHRRATDAGSHSYVDADAIRTMDAWWPLLVEAEFRPGMGDGVFTAMLSALQINDSPSGGQNGPVGGAADVNESQPHKGSSFQFGWWSYVDKDIRAVLGQPVAGGFDRPFCGGGDLAACRQVLLDTLKQAAAEPASQVYPGDSDCAAADQWCADSIIQRPLGGVTDGTIGWQNRPTYQQVVQFPAHRP